MITILIVDDEQAIRDQIRLLLSPNNYEIFDVSSGEAALNLIKSQHVDLVILDQLMPGISGTEVAIKLKKREINFIFCSSSTEIELLKLAMSLGALNYIVKPFIQPEALNVIEGAIERIAEDEKNADIKEAITFLMGFHGLSRKPARSRLVKMARDSNTETSVVSRQILDVADLINHR